MFEVYVNDPDNEDNEIEAGEVVSEEDDPIPDILPEAPPSGLYGGDDAA